ncbi:pectinesterase 11, A. THALIANA PECTINESTERASE 11 [Hibiscus trionum]|uniref:Pectinesterase n=1 Tax=Hibiscus trionum TaxID=183268 RepID=A0A9W7M7T9_HIBTR|nr:pectinesterase 11, A. THALIANA PECTINESTERASE 11 [Hibiscus trionum]
MAPAYSSCGCIFVMTLFMFILASSRADAAVTSTAVLITVDQSGNGDYKKIQDAIDSVPSNNNELVYISVKPGVYEEKIVVPADKSFITISGLKANNVIITWNDSGNIFESPTFSVLASDFVGRYLTIQNTFGPGARAVALRVSGDRTSFIGCRILSYQDTLLDDTGRHYYKNCYIEGAVDFIFGNAASLFERCHVHTLSEGDAAITAQRRESPSENTGFTFLGCKITGVRTAVLGRPWGAYSRVIFAFSYMSNVILPQGWDDWGDLSKQSTVFYREYKCYGPGANARKRVEWSGKLTDNEAGIFLTKNMIGGRSWIRSTPTRFKKASTAISNNSTRHA